MMSVSWPSLMGVSLHIKLYSAHLRSLQTPDVLVPNYFNTPTANRRVFSALCRYHCVKACAGLNLPDVQISGFCEFSDTPFIILSFFATHSLFCTCPLQPIYHQVLSKVSSLDKYFRVFPLFFPLLVFSTAFLDYCHGETK